MEIRPGVNVGGQVDDPSYRYKRDLVAIRPERAMSRTRITNLDRICAQLHVTSEDVCHFFGETLGCRVTSDGLICKKVTVDELEVNLNKFITKYVLCKRCKLPELSPSRMCPACGHDNAFKPEKPTNPKFLKKTKKPEGDEHKNRAVGPEEKDVVGLDGFINELYHEVDRLRLKNGDAEAEAGGRVLTAINQLLDECWECTTIEKFEELKTKWEQTIITSSGSSEPLCASVRA